MSMPEWDDLDEYASEVPEDAYEHPESLDPVRVNAMLRKLGRLRKQGEETVAVADAEISRIKEWVNGRTLMIQTETVRLERALEAYMRLLNRNDTKLKTKQFPNGELKLRAPLPRLMVEDSALTVAHIVKRLGDSLPEDQKHQLLTALNVLGAEPLLRLKLDPAGDAIKKATTTGPSRGVTDGPNLTPFESFEAVLPDGEVLAGVKIVRNVDASFKAVTAIQDADQPTDVVEGEEL